MDEKSKRLLARRGVLKSAGAAMVLASSGVAAAVQGKSGGALLGETLNLESHLENAGKHLQRLTRRDRQEGFVEGFVYASLLFCVGALTIVGCLQAAMEGNGELLYTKSLLDGHVAIFLTGAMGAGVMAASVTILLFQGGLTLFFLWAGPHLPEPVIREMGAAGGLLIIAIGLNLLEIATIRVGNLLPGMFLGALLFWWKSNGFAF